MKSIQTALTLLVAVAAAPVSIARGQTRPAAGAIVWARMAASNVPADSLLARLARQRSAIAVTEVNDRWRSARLRGDAAGLDSLLADTWTTTEIASSAAGPRGPVENKAHYLEDVKSGARSYETIVEGEPSIWIVGDTALVTGETSSRGYLNDVSLSERSHYTRTYALRQGRWRMIAATTTAILTSSGAL